MSVELANEIWSELRRYVNTVDREEAAETMVSVLIDNDISADEIRGSFKDADIKRALTQYLRDESEDFGDDDDELIDDEEEYEDYED